MCIIASGRALKTDSRVILASHTRCSLGSLCTPMRLPCGLVFSMYRSHGPLSNCRCALSAGEDCTYSSEALSAGDAVVVQLNPDLFKAAQEDHGGWIDTMAEVRH